MLFQISHTPILSQQHQAEMTHSAAGGYVSFEGWVRDHNEGKSVVALEYEAYAALAQTEGLRILEEAKQRFEIIDAHCVHRVGVLAIGEMAVWVGVTAAHRKAAFEACEYVINQIKHRLPIWKKETYADGDSGWVNCQHCSDAVHDVPQDQNQAGNTNNKACEKIDEHTFYARQMQLPEIGLQGQSQLKAAKVLVVGAGGLGSAALQCLAAVGIGTLGICDFDVVEVSNLHRQMIYRIEDVGQPKAEVAARHLRQLNPFIQINPYVAQLTAENVLECLQAYDWVLDCTDNFETKYALNDAAVMSKKSLIQTSIYQYEGQISWYDPADAEASCLRCLWPEQPQAVDFPACAAAGVLGTTASYFGTLQAMQLIQQVLKLPGRLQANELLTVDLLSYTVHRFKSDRSENCPICAEEIKAQSLLSGADPISVESDNLRLDLSQLNRAGMEELIWVDLGAEPEINPVLSNLNVWHVPYSQFLIEIPALDPLKKYVLFCATGGRSLYLAKQLRRQGYTKVYSLAGGFSSFMQSNQTWGKVLDGQL